MAFETQIVGHHCAIELTVDQMKKLLDLGSDAFTQLDKETPDAEKVDYEGPFGPFVFFTCVVEDLAKAKEQMTKALTKILLEKQ